MSGLNKEQFIDLLNYIGTSKILDKGGDNIQFCCTVHGENNPSAGFSISKQKFHCFSCHKSGSPSWLLYLSMPDDFNSVAHADEFLKDRYGVDFKAFDEEWSTRMRTYDEHFENEASSSKLILPISKIAPFKSGKETYEYFFDRGFTKDTVKQFSIGRDLVAQTVTIPVFWGNNEGLAGVIGRYIDPKRPKNSRYKIYDFHTGALLFPLNKIEIPESGQLILVEGILDAIWMHQLGIKNVAATLTNAISKEQAKWVKQNAGYVIDMSDNDEMGSLASESYRHRLRGMRILDSKRNYPEGKKDPQECTKSELLHMVLNASMFGYKLTKL